ncbi:hypothetical protein [Hymenobacter yonginensis]|uniref:STAS/SEC14 domain-containing protein n=1 Tax=Hymenobacter yonginensis TaxID=748197 RepID=A0ABY7PKR8_9BACT|nr:hypothetical protein [Hymenobacter yonginensis]WBO83212.1 hypothetical protein O9Z63_12565 [Hymenobacter yonginensis]
MNIEVGNGKIVVMKGLHQTATYSGVIGGLPTEKMNARILHDSLDAARKLFHMHEIYLIEPTQKPLEYKKWYRFGKPAALPAIQCIVELWHHEPAKNSWMDFSALAVVWYQDYFALPINMDVVAQMKNLPWDDVAGSFDY